MLRVLVTVRLQLLDNLFAVVRKLQVNQTRSTKNRILDCRGLTFKLGEVSKNPLVTRKMRVKIIFYLD